MSFSRNGAVTHAKAVSQEALSSIVTQLRGAFALEGFPKIDTLDDIRQMVDVIANEQYRRDIKATMQSAEHCNAREENH